jgi:hypothetical protein
MILLILCICADLLFGLLYIILFKPTKGRKIFNFFVFSFLILIVGKDKFDKLGFSILFLRYDKLVLQIWVCGDDYVM